MTETMDYGPTDFYIWPTLLAILNFSIMLPMAMTYLSYSVELWDFIFIAAGVYLTVKFVRCVSHAHRYKEGRLHPSKMEEIVDRGIYANIRHPLAAGVLYMNLAYFCFTRSLALVPALPIFFALWYALAKHKDDLMEKRFGEKYLEYMASTSMFRGGDKQSGRMKGSGYGMY